MCKWKLLEIKIKKLLEIRQEHFLSACPKTIVSTKIQEKELFVPKQASSW
jgi:hypothetical protein